MVHGALPADAFARAAPAYGVGWVAAMAVCLVVGDPIVALVASKLVSRLSGDRSRSAAMALTNILVTATVMSLYGVVVGGADDVLGAWVHNFCFLICKFSSFPFTHFQQFSISTSN